MPLALAFVYQMVQCLRVFLRHKRFYSTTEARGFVEVTAAISWIMVSLYVATISNIGTWGLLLLLLCGGTLATATELLLKAFRAFLIDFTERTT